MLKICLGFWKSEPQYAYKRYTYKKKCNLLPVTIIQGKQESFSAN